MVGSSIGNPTSTTRPCSHLDASSILPNIHSACYGVSLIHFLHAWGLSLHKNQRVSPTSPPDSSRNPLIDSYAMLTKPRILLSSFRPSTLVGSRLTRRIPRHLHITRIHGSGTLPIFISDSSFARSVLCRGSPSILHQVDLSEQRQEL